MISKLKYNPDIAVWFTVQDYLNIIKTEFNWISVGLFPTYAWDDFKIWEQGGKTKVSSKMFSFQT